MGSQRVRRNWATEQKQCLRIKLVSMECPRLSSREGTAGQSPQNWSWWQKLGEKRGPWGLEAAYQRSPIPLTCSASPLLLAASEILFYVYIYLLSASFSYWVSSIGKEFGLIHYHIPNTQKGVGQNEHSVCELQVNEWMNASIHFELQWKTLS